MATVLGWLLGLTDVGWTWISMKLRMGHLPYGRWVACAIAAGFGVPGRDGGPWFSLRRGAIMWVGPPPRSCRGL